MLRLQKGKIETVKRGIVGSCIMVAVFVLLSGCGKRGLPMPPREKVVQRVEISGFQRGNQIMLSWLMPASNAAKGTATNISRADIYRLAEPLSAPLQLSEEEFASRCTLIAALAVTDADFRLKTLTYKDALEFAGQAARLRYAIRFVNASGQKAAFSNVFLIEPTSKVAANPTGLTAEASQDAVRLKWGPSTANIDASTPPSLLGYNIYRSTSPKEPGKLLNRTPVTVANFADEFFEFGRDYYYFVRSVSVGTQAEPIESAESNVLRFKAVDTFAPTAPASITIAAAPATISIFWAVNLEKDIVGYKLYRSEERDLPQDKWTLLTPDVLTTNTFQDRKVEANKTYHYYLTATDKFGNVSDPSEVVSETVP